MEVDGINLAIGGGAVSAIAGVFGAWIKAKFGKARIEPTPLPVEKVKDFVTVGECKSKMCAMDARIDRMADGQQKILDKLDEMDSRSEERAKAAHDRIDPLIKELAKNIGQVELMKETFIKAAIGGKK